MEFRVKNTLKTWSSIYVTLLTRFYTLKRNHTWLLFLLSHLTHNKCIVDSAGISCLYFLFYNLLSLSAIGLLYVRQVPHLNCLASKLPDHKDLAFKLKRKQFTVEVRCQGYSAYLGCLHKQNIVFSGSSTRMFPFLMLALSKSFCFILLPQFYSSNVFFITCHVTINLKQELNLDAK